MSLKGSNRNWKPWFAVASAALVISAAFATAMRVQAQLEEQASPETTTTPTAPYAAFQYGTLTATTNTINVTMVPVVEANGTVAYENLTIPFTVTQATSGKTTTFTFTPGTITSMPSTITGASAFKAGTYVGPSTVLGGTALINVSNPGIATGGAAEWSLAAAAGANSCTYPATANWYVASPTAANNPLASRLKAAGITANNNGYQYGTTGAESCSNSSALNFLWVNNSLIGVSQMGQNLVVNTFTDENGKDHDTVQGTITFTPYTAPAN